MLPLNPKPQLHTKFGTKTTFINNTKVLINKPLNSRLTKLHSKPNQGRLLSGRKITEDSFGKKIN